MDDITLLIKAFITSLFAAVSLRLGVLNGLLGTFVAAIVLDYLTGIVAAAYLRELSSRTGIHGIVKKVGSCAVIAVALLADEVLAQGSARIGMQFKACGALASIVTVWLILNELISILENLVKMNVALPGFLLKAVRLLKKQVESRGGEPKV